MDPQLQSAGRDKFTSMRIVETRTSVVQSAVEAMITLLDRRGRDFHVFSRFLGDYPQFALFHPTNLVVMPDEAPVPVLECSCNLEFLQTIVAAVLYFGRRLGLRSALCQIQESALEFARTMYRFI